MFIKIYILILISFSFLNASFEKVSIGTIDKYYKNKISKDQIYKIIKEIESTFENQLDKDIFDYSVDGKPINFIFIPPSKLENTISKKISRIEVKKQKIQELKDYFPNKKNKIEKTKAILNKQHKVKYNIIGGSLMGTGGIMAIGCTVGQGLTGMSTLAFSSLVAILSIFISATITALIMNKKNKLPMCFIFEWKDNTPDYQI